MKERYSEEVEYINIIKGIKVEKCNFKNMDDLLNQFLLRKNHRVMCVTINDEDKIEDIIDQLEW